jgi:hypothetical protein
MTGGGSIRLLILQERKHEKSRRQQPKECRHERKVLWIWAKESLLKMRREDLMKKRDIVKKVHERATEAMVCHITSIRDGEELVFIMDGNLSGSRKR